VARNLGLDDVVDHFTLIGDELELLRNKSGATRLGFAVLLKYVIWRGRFPTGSHELPDDAVAHLARQVRVPAGEQPLDVGDAGAGVQQFHRATYDAARAGVARDTMVSDTDDSLGIMTLGPQAEAATIAAFVASPRRRDRLLKVLDTKKRRSEFDRALSHEDLWDVTAVRALGYEQQTADGVHSALRKLGAPDQCRVLGGPLDGEELSLKVALRDVVGSLCGCVVICVAGRLAYHEGEEPSDRSILVRKPVTR